MSNSSPTKQPIADDVTQAEIDKLIEEMKSQGASGCEVVTENGQRFLVCQWPNLS